MEFLTAKGEPVADRLYGDEVNLMIMNGNVEEGDRLAMFPADEHVNLVPADMDMLGILVACSLFTSRGEAKRNGWAANELPKGWAELEIGKLRRRLYVWNPQHKTSDFSDCDHSGCNFAPCNLER